MKRKETVTVVENAAIARGVYRLALSDARGECFAAAAPGQFVNVYLNNDTMLLPRPFGISDVEDGGCERRLVVVYAVVGAGTAELTSYAPGTEIRILGPNGNGYNLDVPARHVLLIGGGLGIPPLLFAARRIRRNAESDGSAKVTALLGYRDDPYYSGEMRRYCDDVFDISEPEGTVLDLIGRLASDGELDLTNMAILSCGPTPMLRAVAEWAKANGVPAQVSLEERMGCGYGACVGCTVAAKVPGTSRVARLKICKDGPVFPSDAVIW